MAGYTPLNISGNETGLVQERQEFILPNDAYPTLQNAYVWREKIKRKQGNILLGRLKRSFIGAIGNTDGSGNFFTNLIALIPLESTSTIVLGSFSATVGANTITENDPPDGSLLLNGSPSGNFINYATTILGLVTGAPATPVVVSFEYYPGLPVMGLRSRELNNINNEETIAFDQRYAYTYLAGWQEFIPGTTWNAQAAPVTGVDFFWSMNYWVTPPTSPQPNKKLFWVTNDTGDAGANADPVRYTEGTVWEDFTPTIDASGNLLLQFLAMVPFRGRMITFNTWEGTAFGSQINYSNRVRWSAIGNPISDVTALFPIGTVNNQAWLSDVRGQGGFINIPTSEAITSVGFVRDNVVVYCERSTWQLRYTGRSIQPFQIERVNSELGSESTFSSVQFDTSLVTVGDKGIVECDSFKSDRIDIKIPDLVFQFNNQNNGTKRVQGIRNFVERLAYWTYPYAPNNQIFPDSRLVYNYENDSWAIFNDWFTALGTFQQTNPRTWEECTFPWQEANFSWINRPSLIPEIVGGNQQGFVSILDQKVGNGATLSITAIAGNAPSVTVITSPNHTLLTNQVIEISAIPEGTPFASTLNNGIFGITVLTANTFELYLYNADEEDFTTPQIDPAGVYVGGGLITIRDNFSITSKKFNFIEEGQNIQIGYVDVLTDTTENGAISMNVYIDYDDDDAVNTLPLNIGPDTFFNTIIPTSKSFLGGPDGSKKWQRIFCPARGNFITIEYTLSNAQMAGVEQENDVQIDSQILWQRRAGRLTQI